MSHKNVILSVVVPTKNRYHYLNFIIKYFLKIDSDHIELIIHDNSNPGANKKLLSDLAGFNDKRIKYFTVEDDLCQTENCDLAISKACGEWITMIGDDDIFSKHLVDYCERWSALGYEAVLPNKASYTWPDVEPRFYKSSMSGKFRVESYSGATEAIDVSELPSKISKLGGTEMLNMPRVYHGVVKKEILDEVYTHSGAYSPGPSPDIANAIALCRYLTTFVSIDLPLIISGQSIASAGGKGAQGEHYGEIAEVTQLPKNASDVWNQGIPFYWSGKTIYAESVLKSLTAMGMSSELNLFNYNYLYASCLVFDGNRDYRDRIFRAYRANTKSNVFKLAWYFVKIWCFRITFHIQKNLGLLFSSTDDKSKISYVSDIVDVVELLDDLILEIK